MKNFIRISSLALLLAAGAALPALAVTEEDAAAPAGSFTSDMTAPAPHMQFAAHRGDHFAHHHFHRMAMRMPHSFIE